MDSYYERLKNSRLSKKEITLIKKNMQQDSAYNLTNLQWDSVKTTTINSEFKFLNYIKYYMRLENIGLLDDYAIIDDQLYVHNIDNYLITEYFSYYENCYPKDIFCIENNILNIEIINQLKEKYKINSIDEIISSIDKDKPLNDIFNIIINILNNNGTYYGFYCPSIRWLDTLKIKKPMKVTKFTISTSNVLNHICNKLIRIDKSGRVRPVKSNSGSIAFLKSKDNIVPVPYNTGWIFSLTEEHLNERINKLILRHEHNLKNKIRILKNEINQQKIDIINRRRELDQLLEIIDHLNENKIQLWKWRE